VGLAVLMRGRVKVSEPRRRRAMSSYTPMFPVRVWRDSLHSLLSHSLYG
jgi:hypothetical protein